jgi:hypothetical protein
MAKSFGQKMKVKQDDTKDKSEGFLQSPGVGKIITMLTY